MTVGPVVDLVEPGVVELTVTGVVVVVPGVIVIGEKTDPVVVELVVVPASVEVGRAKHEMSVVLTIIHINEIGYGPGVELKSDLEQSNNILTFLTKITSAHPQNNHFRSVMIHVYNILFVI